MKKNSKDIAIVGMGSLFPDARTPQEFWNNIIRKRDSIRELKEAENLWFEKDYFDPNPLAPDKTYSNRAAYLPEIDFNPLEYGIPPKSLEAISIVQLFALYMAKQALGDANLLIETSTKETRDKVGVILGVGGVGNVGFRLGQKGEYVQWKRLFLNYGMPEQMADEVMDRLMSLYVDWQEGSFPGFLTNVVAGRITNRFDLGGINCTVDAACASSLAAFKMAIQELRDKSCDAVLTGGVNVENSIFSFMCFTKTPALSFSNICRPFDADADGMILGDGVGMFVLKRLEDAERDNDKIYSIIKGIGASSDGRARSIFSPNPDGQIKALQRAYRDAGFNPETIKLIEAHGTGTRAGDKTEFLSYSKFLGEYNIPVNSIALGTVKSQIGHTRLAAGAGSVMKTAMALHHKVLPPTINVKKLNPSYDIKNSPLYISTDSQPWFNSRENVPRRAGVSAFGFGGSNFHLVMEEYRGEDKIGRLADIPYMIVISANTNDDLIKKCRALKEKWFGDRGTYFLMNYLKNREKLKLTEGNPRLAFVAVNLNQVKEFLDIAISNISKITTDYWEHFKGIYYHKTGIRPKGKTVALFPGQGSQYIQMGKSLALNFETMRSAFEAMDEALLQEKLDPISEKVFPVPQFEPDYLKTAEKQLIKTENSQPAIGAVNLGMLNILREQAFEPDFALGHSFGELTALKAGGVLDQKNYLKLVISRAQAMAQSSKKITQKNSMMAIRANQARSLELIKDFADVQLTNINTPEQTVVGGAKTSIEKFKKVIEEKGETGIILDVSNAFHTAYMKEAIEPFAKKLQNIKFHKPKIPVYSNYSSEPYTGSSENIKELLTQQLLNPVRFQHCIENIYAKGGSIFVEIGPKNTLTKFVRTILADKEHITISLNPASKKDDEYQFFQGMAKLHVYGFELKNIYETSDYRWIEPPITAKSQLSVTLNGGDYYDPDTIKKRHHLLTEQTNEFEKFIEVQEAAKENMSGSKEGVAVRTPPIIEPSAEVIPENIPETLEDFNLNIEAQTTAYKIHKKFQENQSLYLRILDKTINNQSKLIDNLKDNENLPRAIENMNSGLDILNNNQKNFYSSHECYLNNQLTLAKMIQETYRPETNAPVFLDQPQNKKFAATKKTKRDAEAVRIKKFTAGHESVIEKATAFNNEKTLEMKGFKTPDAGNQTALKAAKENQASFDPEEVLKNLLSIVCEKTGYPEDTIEMDMDLEADLGIDSIKRIEILGAMKDIYGDVEMEIEALAELRTLQEIVDLIKNAAVEPQDEKAMQMEGFKNSDSGNLTSLKAAQENQASFNPEEVLKNLLSIVCEKTGYPEDTIEMDMDLEADLGIDSIKRIEILGAMKDIYGDVEMEIEALAELRTLREIVDLIKNAAAESETGKVYDINKPTQNADNIETEKQDSLIGGDEEIFFINSDCEPEIRVTGVTTKLLPDPDQMSPGLLNGCIWLLTDYDRELSVAFAEKLSEHGQKVVILSFPDEENRNSKSGFEVVKLKDLSVTALENALKQIEKDFGSIGGFMHFHPNKKFNSIADGFESREYEISKVIFFSAKYLQPSFCEMSKKNRIFFQIITRMDGYLGLQSKTIQPFISSGLSGFAKSLQKEWPDVYCKFIDLAPEIELGRGVNIIFNELGDISRKFSEIGINNDEERFTLERSEDIDIPENKIEETSLKDTVFIVTGGGRGITAECVLNLAKAHQSKFILLGRTSLIDSEPDWAQNTDDISILKKNLVKYFKQKEKKVKPADMDKIVNKIVAQKEIKKTIKSIEKAGGEAVYVSTDIMNFDRLMQTIDGLSDQFKNITGIIHGAGNLADKQVQKKTPNDFELVFGTKIKGLENLIKAIVPERLTHLILFSSIVAFKGNIGQTDYAMANEVLNKFAYSFKNQYPAVKVVSMNWGPWDGGMVTPLLKKVYKQLNISTIQASVGKHIFCRELTNNHSHPQIIISCDYNIPLKTKRITSLKNLRRTVSLKKNPFLKHHLIGKYPVLPAACAANWMAKISEDAYFGYDFKALNSFKVLKGVVFNNELNENFIIDLTVKSNNGPDIEIAVVIKTIRPDNGRDLLHYSGNVILTSKPGVIPHEKFKGSEKNKINHFNDMNFNGMNFYSKGAPLFHGKSFQGIKAVMNKSADQIDVLCGLDNVKVRHQGQFQPEPINHFMVDIGLQTPSLYVFDQKLSGLPVAIESLSTFKSVNFDKKFFISMKKLEQTDIKFRCNIAFYNEQGDITMEMKNAQFTFIPMSRAKQLMWDQENISEL